MWAVSWLVLVLACMVGCGSQPTPERGEPGAAGPRGPQGTPGMQGPMGAPGQPGPDLSKDRVYKVIETYEELGPNVVLAAPAYCHDPDDVLLTGGCWLDVTYGDALGSPYALLSSYPMLADDEENAAGWVCSWRVGSVAVAVSVVAVCLETE